MSFKDKLKTIKTKKQTTKTEPQLDVSNVDTSDDLNLPSMEELANSVPADDTFTGEEFDDIPDFDDEPAPKKSKSSRKKPKKVKKAKKASAGSDSDTKRKIILLALLLLIGLCALGYVLKDTLLGSDTPDATATPQPTKTQPVTPPKPETNPAPPQPNETQDASGTPDSDTATAVPPSSEEKFEMLNEEIKTEIPNTEVEAAEEIDALTDESQRLDAQVEDMNKLLEYNKELFKLRNQKIAELEKDIAAAEAAIKEAK